MKIQFRVFYKQFFGLDSSYYCNCVNGYTGTNCEFGPPQSNPCTSSPCKIISRNFTKYLVKIPLYFLGLNGGTCYPLSSSQYTCSCKTNYYGFNCESTTQISYNFCVLSPCLNGGQCQNLGPNQYYCNCPSGFMGTYCEQAVTSNVCSSRPCQNAGTCYVNNDGTYRCICLGK